MAKGLYNLFVLLVSLILLRAAMPTIPTLQAMMIFWAFENEESTDCAYTEEERDFLIDLYEIEKLPYTVTKVIKQDL